MQKFCLNYKKILLKYSLKYELFLSLLLYYFILIYYKLLYSQNFISVTEFFNTKIYY